MNTELRMPAEQGGKWQEWAEKDASKVQSAGTAPLGRAGLPRRGEFLKAKVGISQQENNVGV